MLSVKPECPIYIALCSPKCRTMGPLIHRRAVAKVEAHVKDAIDKGAQVLVGGKRGEGNFYHPTVLADVSNDSLLAKEETFGPLCGIIKFETEEEVIRMANDTTWDSLDTSIAVT